MRLRPTAVLAWALWLLFATGTGVGLFFKGGRGFSGDIVQDIPLLVAFTAYATVGGVVASRRPRNRIGWMFLAIGVLVGVGGAGEVYSERAFPRPGDPPTLAVLAAWLDTWFWFPLVAMATLFTLLLFPSGLPSPRWRPVLWLSVLSVASVTVMSALSPTLEAAGRTVRNPIAIAGVTVGDVEESVPFQVFSTLVGVGILASVASLVLRFRRARGDERLQLKWFVYAAVLVGLTILTSIAIPAYDRSDAGGIVFGVVLACLPVAVGIAILRYRLYDIDRIINRTLVYGSLTLLLGGLYVGVVVGVGSLVGESGLLVAASTLLVAALFRPARRRVQELTDRRFYRKKYDAARTLEAFSARLRDEVDLDALGADLVAVVRETMQPAHASLWLRPQEAHR